MRALIVLLLALVVMSPILAVDTPIELSLLDGSRIKGRIVSATASEVTVMSDFGVLRIALEKLTPESRAKATEGSKPDVDALVRRVAELEAKVSQLQQENETLRRQAMATPAPAFRPSGAQSLTPSTPTARPSAGSSFTMSSTGKRHNSGCRYYGTGRSCGPTEGIACKICGG